MPNSLITDQDICYLYSGQVKFWNSVSYILPEIIFR